MWRAPIVGRGGITGGAREATGRGKCDGGFKQYTEAPRSAAHLSSLAHSRLAVHTGLAFFRAGRLDAETVGAGREAQPMTTAQLSGAERRRPAVLRATWRGASASVVNLP